MTRDEHDPLCPVNTMAPNEGGCYCSLVRRVRADERNIAGVVGVCVEATKSAARSDHDALCPAYGEQRSPQSCRCRLIAAIRADERAQNEGARVTFTVTADGLVAAIDDPLDVGWTRLALDLIPQLVANDRDARRLAALRAKVEALPGDLYGYVYVGAVLALIDGGGDE